MNLRIFSKLQMVALLCGAAGNLLAQGTMTATPTSVTFSFPLGSTIPITQQVQVTAPITTTYGITVSPVTLGPYLLTPGTGQTNNSLQVTLQNPQAFTSAASGTIRLTPATGSGLSPLDIPVSINPGGSTGTTGITANPASLTYVFPTGTTAQQTQYVQLSSLSNVALTPTFSANLSGYMTVTGLLSSNSQMAVTLTSPQFFNTAVFGSLTLTPALGSGLNALTIPITINPGGSGTSNITASPNPVTFSYVNGTGTALSQTIQLTAPTTLNLTPSLSANLNQYFQLPSVVSSNSQFTLTLLFPSLITVPTTGTLTLTPPTGSSLTPLYLPVTINPGGGGTSTVTATPASLVYTYPAGTVGAVSQSTQLSSTVSTTLTTSLSPNLAPYFSLPTAVSSNGMLTMTLVSPQSITSATTGYLSLMSGGITQLQIPVSVNPGGTSGSGLTTSPLSLSYTFPAGTVAPQSQSLLITAPSTVALTPTFSGNIANAFTAPLSITSNSQISVTLQYPQLVPSGTTGYLTLTPPAGSGLSAISVPIYVNTGGTGTGQIVATPATVAFTSPLNGATQSQNVTLTASDGSSQSVFVSASSPNNFLSVSQSSFTTPLTIVVRVNPAAVTTPGQYSGTVGVQSGQGTLLASIPVTLTVGANVTVTPSPTSATLTAAAGATTPATTTVQLTSTDNTIPFTTSVATTDGAGWLSVTPTTGNLGSSITINANASSLAVGSYSGTVTVSAQGVTVATIPVSLTVTTSATIQVSPSTLTFAHQTTSTTAPANQTVQITSSSTTALNWSATATSTGGWLQVTPSSGTTPGTLTVSIVPTGLTANSYTGTITVSSAGATNSPQTINVTLNVTTPSLPQIISVVNAASFAPTVAVPGEIVTIRGTDMGPATGVSGAVDNAGYLGTNVSGVRVLFDNVAAPILYASATQINAVIPYDIANRVSTRLQVQYQNQMSRELELRVGDTAPGLFASAGNGAGEGAILNQNGSINSASNPERRGNIIVLFGTGQGQTNPPGTTGLILNSPRFPLASVQVRIGGQPADILYAGSLPGGVAGAMQINVRIPQNVGTGALPVELQVGNATSQAGLTVAVQ